MSAEWLTFARVLPLVALPAAVLIADHLELWSADAEAAVPGFPDIGSAEAEAARIMDGLLQDDTRLADLEHALKEAGLPLSDPLIYRLNSLNHSQDLLADSVARTKGQLAAADMSGTFRGNVAEMRGRLVQLSAESRGLSYDIDQLEKDVRARGIMIS